MTDEKRCRLDPERQRPENSWTVSTTAMTQAEAERAAELIEGKFSEVLAQAVDPRSSSSCTWTAGPLRRCEMPLQAC